MKYNNTTKNKPLSALGIETDKSVSIGSNQLVDEDINIVFKMIGPEISLQKFVVDSQSTKTVILGFVARYCTEQEYEDQGICKDKYKIQWTRSND